MCDGDRTSASALGLEEWLQWEVMGTDCATGPGFLEHRTPHELHKVCLAWERAGFAVADLQLCKSQASGHASLASLGAVGLHTQSSLTVLLFIHPGRVLLLIPLHYSLQGRSVKLTSLMET